MNTVAPEAPHVRRPTSLIDFQRRFPDEAACAAWLFTVRWPAGFRCPACDHAKGWRHGGKPFTFECAACGKQTSVTAGTIMHGSKFSAAKKGIRDMSADAQENILFGQSGGQHKLARFVDHRETYGPHVVEGFVRTLQHVRIVVDLGAGSGRDLAIVKRCHPPARTIAVEGHQEYAAALTNNVDQVHVLDIERDILPLSNESVDLIIANQVLEHTKEVFWIFHEVTRSLRIGGHFLIGVPNIVSLHNRLIMLSGGHPTTHKLCSAHVRPFSKSDTLKFLAACFPDGYALVSFSGSQFYPFPPRIARALARLVPTAAFSIFFLLQKRQAYRSEFLEYPARAHLETNYWTGEFKR